VARRIAAEWSGRASYLPTRAPKGVYFTDWKTITDGGAGDERLAVDFGGADLRWQVSPSSGSVRKRSGIVCGHPSVDGRTVGGSTETAWTCLTAGFRITVSISQRSGRDNALPSDDLEAMVASARPLPPGRARGSRYELVPQAEVRRLGREFGTQLYLPRSLPRGFIFTGWSLVRHAPGDGRRWVFVTFGRDGVLLHWSVYSGVEKFAIECPHGHPSRWDLKRSMLIQGRRILFADGIHGASAWECIPPHAIGNPEPLEVALWYDIRLDYPAMRRTARQVVAGSQLIPVE
jgi:hypothetical protein